MIRFVSPTLREFVMDVSFVTIGSENSIRGIAVGDIGLAIAGLVLMAMIVTELAFGPVLGRLYLRLFRRPPGRRSLQIAIALIGIGTVSDGARCVTSFSHGDWGSGLFYGLRMTAGAGILSGIPVWLPRNVAGGTHQQSAAVAAEQVRRDIAATRESLRSPRP
jgi:MFS family permease